MYSITSLSRSGRSTQFPQRRPLKSVLSRLVLDTFESPYGYIPIRVWHGHPALFRRMFELLVVPYLIYLIPAVLLQFLYEVSAVHASSRLLSFMIHILYTLIQRAGRQMRNPCPSRLCMPPAFFPHHVKPL